MQSNNTIAHYLSQYNMTIITTKINENLTASQIFPCCLTLFFIININKETNNTKQRKY